PWSPGSARTPTPAPGRTARPGRRPAAAASAAAPASAPRRKRPGCRSPRPWSRAVVPGPTGRAVEGGRAATPGAARGRERQALATHPLVVLALGSPRLVGGRLLGVASGLPGLPRLRKSLAPPGPAGRQDPSGGGPAPGPEV